MARGRSSGSAPASRHACIRLRLGSQRAQIRIAQRALGDVVGALAHAVAEIEPRAEPGDPRRGGSLVEDQEDVAPAVRRESAPGIEVGLPAVAGAQLLDRGADQLALGGAAGFALLVGEGTALSWWPSAGPPCGSGGASRRGPGCLTAPLRHARQGVPPFAGERAARAPGVPYAAAQASSPSTVVLRHARPWPAAPGGSASLRPAPASGGAGERSAPPGSTGSPTSTSAATRRSSPS